METRGKERALTIETLESVISTQCPGCRAAGGLQPGCETCAPVAERPLALAPMLDRWTAATRLRRALGPAFLRPEHALEAIEPKALRPVLVPAWSLDCEVRSRWTTGPHRRGTRSFSVRGLIVPGVTGPAASLVASALAASVGEPVEADADALSEWNPLSVSRTRSEAWEEACRHLSGAAGEEAALGLSLDETEALRVETRFEHPVQRSLLVPVWRAAGPGFELLIDACGGRVIGNAPWHPLRLAAFAGAGGLVLGLLAALLL